MHLSLHGDYALRILIYLGAHPGKRVSTQQISNAYGISRYHLVRVVQTLGEAGYCRISPGKSGGIALAMLPGEIRLGKVVKDTEPSLRIVECFDQHTNTCAIAPVCGLKSALKEALQAFLCRLDQYTLQDLLSGRQEQKLSQIFLQIESRTTP